MNVVEPNPNFGAEFAPQLDAFLGKLADKVAETARQRAPQETGALRSSIAGSASGGEAVIAADVPYATYVELGTGKMGPRPYLRPALEVVKHL